MVKYFKNDKERYIFLKNLKAFLKSVSDSEISKYNIRVKPSGVETITVSLDKAILAFYSGLDELVEEYEANKINTE